MRGSHGSETDSPRGLSGYLTADHPTLVLLNTAEHPLETSAMIPTQFLNGGPTIGSSAPDLQIPSVIIQELVNAVDDLLPDDFELFELEGDESVYFSYADRGEEATAEIRFTTAREKGYTEDIGPRYALSIVVEGPDPDNKSTWFSLEDAVDFAVKQIRRSLRVGE